MEMPRACPVESHVLATLADSASWRCHGLVPRSLTFSATLADSASWRCHGLVPWSLTFSLLSSTPLHGDATGLSRGVSRSLLPLAATARCSASRRPWPTFPYTSEFVGSTNPHTNQCT